MNPNGKKSPTLSVIYLWVTTMGIVLGASFMLTLIVDDAAAEPMPGSYHVVGDKVDRGTYLGWTVFHTNCYGSHGVDALGNRCSAQLGGAGKAFVASGIRL